MSALFKHRREHELKLLLIWTACVTVLSLFVLKPEAAWVPTLLYFVVPTGYLVYKYKPHYEKIFFGTLLIGIVIPLSFDLLIHVNGSWFVPFDKLLIPYKFLGFYPVDELLWFMLLAAYTIVFYEVFVDDERILRISKNLKEALIVWGVANVAVLVSIFYVRDLLLVPYSYLLIVAPFSFPPIFYVM